MKLKHFQTFIMCSSSAKSKAEACKSLNDLISGVVAYPSVIGQKQFISINQVHQVKNRKSKLTLLCCRRPVELDVKQGDMPEQDGRLTYEGTCSKCGKNHHLISFPKE